MPVLLFPLLLAAILFLTPLSFLSVPPVPAPAPVPYASEQVVQMHYTVGPAKPSDTFSGKDYGHFSTQ